MATKRKKAKAKGTARRPARSGRRVAEMGAKATPKPEMSREDAQRIAGHIIGDDPPGSGPERETPRNVDMWATRPFGYGGIELDRGQVFRLKGMRNDKILVDLGYCQPAGQDRFACRICGGEFIDLGALDGHGRSRHEPKRIGPAPPMRADDESEVSYQTRLDQWALDSGAAQDAHAEREDRRADELHPLHTEQTAASRA